MKYLLAEYCGKGAGRVNVYKESMMLIDVFHYCD
jgi:hypothetical protein